MKDRPDLVVHTSTHWTNGDEASLSYNFRAHVVDGLPLESNKNTGELWWRVIVPWLMKESPSEFFAVLLTPEVSIPSQKYHSLKT